MNVLPPGLNERRKKSETMVSLMCTKVKNARKTPHQGEESKQKA